MLLSEYPDDFRSYWGLDRGNDAEHLDAMQQVEYQRLSQLVTKLARGAALLIRPPKLRTDDLTQMAWLEEEAELLRARLRETLDHAKEKLPDDVWWEVYWATRPREPGDPRVKQEFMDNCMQLEAADLFPAWPGDIAKRLFRLVALVLENPTRRTREFLPRVAACYVRDMKAELAVMSRAVLDVALKELLASDERVADDAGLEQRIQRCLRVGVFEADVFDAAQRLQREGNRGAHGIPPEADADTIIRDLLMCMRRLDEVSN